MNRPDESSNSRGVYPYGKVRVLVIGSNTYPNAIRYCNITHAESDARNISDLFRSVFGYDVSDLIGPMATKSEIRKKLDEVKRGLEADDALIVYFAGHGQLVDLRSAGTTGFIVPSDAKVDLENKTDIELWSRECIAMSDVLDVLNDTPAKHVMLIADCCFSGNFTSRHRGGFDWEVKNMFQARSRMVLSSTAPGQKAQDGRFTGELIKALKSLSGSHRTYVATLNGLMYGILDADLADDAQKKVVYCGLLHDVAERSKGKMHPQLARFGDGAGTFVFIPSVIPKSTIERALRDCDANVIPGLGSGTFEMLVRDERDRHQQFTRPRELYETMVTHPYQFGIHAAAEREKWSARYDRFLKNATGGDVWAMACLYHCYFYGLGTDVDPQKAFFWAKQAYNTPGAPGLGEYLLSISYKTGYSDGPSGPGAEELHEKLFIESIEKKCKLAYSQFYALHKNNRTVTINGAIYNPMKMLEEASNEGIYFANNILALAYWKMSDKDPSAVYKAVKLLERNVAVGDARACQLLSAIYGKGHKLVSLNDLKRSLAYLQQAVDIGDPDAMYYLATEHCQHGKGNYGALVQHDLKKGFQLFDRAAQMGDHRALWFTAKMYRYGEGVQADFGMAIRRLDDAIEQGSKNALFSKGIWQLEGTGYPQDDAAALKSFIQASNAGVPLGAVYAGMLFQERRGTIHHLFQDDADKAGVFHTHWSESLHYYSLSVKDGVTPENIFALRAYNVLNDIHLAMSNEENPNYQDESLKKTIKDGRISREKQKLWATSVYAKWKMSFPATHQWYEQTIIANPKAFSQLPNAKADKK